MVFPSRILHALRHHVGSGGDHCNLHAARRRSTICLATLSQGYRLKLHPKARRSNRHAPIDALNCAGQIEGNRRLPTVVAGMTAVAAKETEGSDVVAICAWRFGG